MEADGDEGDEHGDGGGKREDPPGDRGSIGEVLQPGVHGEPGDGRGDDQGDGDETQELLGEKADDGGYGGSEYLPDADLFGALDGAVGGEAE